MKWSIKYIVSALPFLFTACSGDWLDLDPSTSVTSDNAIQSLEDAKTALNGIYRIASEHSYYGDNYLYYADCRGEDVQARIDKGPGRRVSPYYLFNVAADDAFNITRVWNQPYIVIHQANSLIEKIDNGSVQTSDTQEIARIKAEALAMRGLALFDLTRLFGMPYTLDNGASLGVPIEIKTELPTHQPSRNTVAECYNQVIKDLTEALPNLVTTKSDGHQNVWSVKALLSRIYLYMNDNENALKYAQEVINNGGLYTLFTHDEYTSVWGKDFNSESLFEFYFTLTEPSGGSGGEGAPMVYADNVKDWNNLVLTKDFLDLLGEDPDDVRHALCRLPQKLDEDILPTGSTGHPKYLAKYPGKTGVSSLALLPLPMPSDRLIITCPGSPVCTVHVSPEIGSPSLGLHAMPYTIRYLPSSTKRKVAALRVIRLLLSFATLQWLPAIARPRSSATSRAVIHRPLTLRSVRNASFC